MPTEIKTGPLYIKTVDGEERMLASTGELKSVELAVDEPISTAFGVTPEVVSFTISGSAVQKLRNVLLKRRVWYKKRKGKRYIWVYRYEDILIDMEKEHKQIKKRLRKWQKRIDKLWDKGLIERVK